VQDQMKVVASKLLAELKEEGILVHISSRDLLGGGWAYAAFAAVPGEEVFGGPKVTVCKELGIDRGILVKWGTKSLIATTSDGLAELVGAFLVDVGVPEKEYDCMIRLNCEYSYVLRTKGRTKVQALHRALDEGQHIDIDKMEQSWSPIEVDEAETVKVDV